MYMNENSISDILLNQICIPVKLFTTYTSLGLDEKDIIIIIQIHRYLQMNQELPTPSKIAKHLTISEEECATKLRYLLQKNYLEIKQFKNEQGKLSEAYSLEPLWDRLLIKDEEKENEEGKLFQTFEKEFGRPLSPFEIDTINIWLDDDKIKPKIIISALREAVLMDKLNFKYIDRILREWQRKGVQTVEQAKQVSEPYRKGQVVKTYKQEKRDTSVYFNWLDDGGS